MLILSKLTHELFYILNAGVHSQENVKISFDFVKTHCLKPRYIRCPFPPVQMGSIFWWPSSISAPNLLSTVVGTWVCTNGGVLGVPWSTRYLNRSRLVIDQPCRLRARQLLLLKAGDSGRTIIGANLECNTGSGGAFYICNFWSNVSFRQLQLDRCYDPQKLYTDSAVSFLSCVVTLELYRRRI